MSYNYIEIPNRGKRTKISQKQSKNIKLRIYDTRKDRFKQVSNTSSYNGNER